MAGKALTVLVFVVIVGAIVGVFLINKTPTVPLETEDPSPAEQPREVSTTTAQGIEYAYPEQLDTTFISAQEWPPHVRLVAGDVVCKEGDVKNNEGFVIRRSKHVVGDRTYCVDVMNEGAAGSTYTTYEYVEMGDANDMHAHLVFVFRYPQCMNYDDLQQSACKAEQASFDIDGLVDRIASSIRMQ